MKNCLECTRCVLHNDLDWSELTPGDGLKFYCSKGYWDWSHDRDMTKGQVAKDLARAESCLDFEEEEPRKPQYGTDGPDAAAGGVPIQDLLREDDA